MRPGKRAERIMKQRGMTQRELAKRLRVTPGGVNAILNSDKWLTVTLCKMAIALGVAPWDLDEGLAPWAKKNQNDRPSSS